MMIDPLIAQQNRRSAASSNDALIVTDVAPVEKMTNGQRALRRRRRRKHLRRAALVIAVLMAPVAYSYVNALTGPGSDSLQARTVEWARDHHLGPVVDRVERWWYDHHQAKIGGTPSAGAGAHVAAAAGTARPVGRSPQPLSRAGTTASTPGSSAPATPAISTPTTVTSTDPAVTAPPPPPGPPAPLQTPAGTPVAGEGVWAPLGPTVNGRVGAYVTVIRPDDVHTSVLDAVVRFDPSVFSFRAYPGTTIPGAPWDRPDHVDQALQGRLVAAFAGGFRIRDSHGGFLLGGQSLRPMRIGGATLAIDANGVPTVGIWGRDINPNQPLDSARQNLDLIVDNGSPVPNLETDPNRQWGFTGPANKSAVWRSGAGVTADGALIWVGGPGLTIQTLAETLVRAGAVRGMQLEINQEWVQFNTYATDATGAISGKRLLDGMRHTGDRWLSEDTRDFVAVFAR